MSAENRTRYENLGFKPQKEVIYNKLLPYAEEIDDESSEVYKTIKFNLIKSVHWREIRPGCEFWTAKLDKYIHLYGFKFSKEDHIALIKLMYELITIPDLEPTSLKKFAWTLVILLKKRDLISPKELTLPWKPLYELCKQFLKKERGLRMYCMCVCLKNIIKSLVHAARIYFPASATQEMLDEWRAMLCPFDNKTISNAVMWCEWFLPIALPPSENHLAYELWFREFMALWQTCSNAPKWETDMMWLMARLAAHNIGYIDWSPYIPIMYTRFLRSLDLPVAYQQMQSPKRHKIDTSAVAVWIVSTIGGGDNTTFKYLEKLMQTLASYYHPANSGHWAVKLSELFQKLAFHFVERLHRERYKKETWQTPVPDTHRITETDIDTFVEIMKPIAVEAIYSHCTIEINQALHYLATLRANVIVPLVLDKIYSTLDSLTEPHRLTASLLSLIAVARPMVQGHGFENNYPEGPTHVIPLLTAMLPGVDLNDIRKSFVTFKFISMFVLMIPLVDSSEAPHFWPQLTDEERAVCSATAGFEDFVLQLFDRVFAFIESSSLETTRMEEPSDADTKSNLEMSAENALLPICMIITTQMSPPIFKSALGKLYDFITGNILETQVSGQMLAVVCRSFTRVKPEETLAQLVPHLCTRINKLLGIGNELLNEECLDNELLYNMFVLCEMLDCNGASLLPYADALMAILDRTVHLACRQANVMASQMLQQILNSLTVLRPMEYCSVVPPLHKPIEQHLSIRDWAKPGNIHDLQIQWYQPGDKEIACAQKLLNRYLLPELDCLNAYINDNAALTRDELQRSLNIILAILGAQDVLPKWQEPPLHLVPSKFEPWAFQLNIGVSRTVTMPNGDNVRKVIGDVMHRLQQKILRTAEDDIKNLCLLIAVWDTLITNTSNGRDYEALWKIFQTKKKLLEDRLHGNKCHLRPLLIERAMLQHKFRKETSSHTFSETHAMILVDLYALSTSHYSEVRIRAQKALFKIVRMFPHSYTVLTDHLKRSLQVDSNEKHEEFKGCLNVLLGPKSKAIIAQPDWTFLREIWPLLVRAKPSEKASVIRLLQSIMELLEVNFPTISLRVSVPEVCLEAAEALAKHPPLLPSPIVTSEERAEGENRLKLVNAQNERTYYSITESLLDAMLTNNLHWRYHTMALSFIRTLNHPHAYYSEQIVRYVLQTLIHESLEMRKIAIHITTYILKQHKREVPKITIDPRSFCKDSVPTESATVPGYRADNEWLQYHSKTRPLTETEWKKHRYLHKQYQGYYTWPKTVEVYGYTESVPQDSNLLSPALIAQQGQVDLFFGNENSVATLIRYLSIEEKKGRDKFNHTKMKMFKKLFRSRGDIHVNLFVPHLKHLVSSKEEQQQRCAAEIVAALIHGSKHWSFESTVRLWSLLDPIIRSALANMTVETVLDWRICFTTAADNRDPNRLHWLYELLMEDSLRMDEVSYIYSGRLSALQGALGQQMWRAPELYERLFVYLRKDSLTYPFQNVRRRISSLLVNIFEINLVFSGGKQIEALRLDLFFAEIVPKLNVLYLAGSVKDVESTDVASQTSDVLVSAEQFTEADKDIAIRLFKTVAKWIVSSITRSNFGAVSEFYQIFSLACLLQSYEGDKELKVTCRQVLAVLAQSLTLAQHVPAALDAIETVARSRSWSARAACTQFIQVFVFHNMSTILSSNAWISRILDMVLHLLADERPEVRVQASQVLGGLVHCHFVSDEQTAHLLETFHAELATKLHAGNARDGTRIRHAAVLGLCAFIDAHPYDVPKFLPPIFPQLGAHLNDPQPIPTTIRKTFGNFKRTHRDNWETHKQKFSEYELDVLMDVTIPHSYYA